MNYTQKLNDYLSGRLARAYTTLDLYLELAKSDNRDFPDCVGLVNGSGRIKAILSLARYIELKGDNMSEGECADVLDFAKANKAKLIDAHDQHQYLFDTRVDEAAIDELNAFIVGVPSILGVSEAAE